MEKLKSLNCEFVPVPVNMTHQPLDLTVNGAVCGSSLLLTTVILLRKSFTVARVLKTFRLTAIKPLHA